MKTNPKFIIIFLIISLLLTVFVTATTTLYKSSDAAVACTDATWTGGSAAAHDDNFGTSDTSTGFDAAYCWWNYTISGSVNNAYWRVKAGGDDKNITLPDLCKVQNPIQVKTLVAVNPFQNSTWEYCYNGTGFYQVWSAGVGLSNPNFFFEQELITDTTPNIPSYALTCPTNNCIFHDEFNYTDPVTYYGWLIEPQFLNITPMSDLFYPPQTLELYHGINLPHFYNKNYDTYNLWFIGTAGNADCNGGYYEASGYNEHKLIYSDYTDNQLKTVYDITFYYDTSTHLISGYSLLPDNTLNTFCADCFSPYYPATIEIYSFNNGAISDKFFNVTSGLLQPYLPNTFTVLINSVPVAYNIPMSENLTDGHSNLITNNYYITTRCIALDTIDIYGFTNAVIPISNNTFRQIGENCLNPNHTPNNALCASGKCSYGKCALLLNNEACTSNSYCLSGSCNNGFCSNPGQWALINAGTKELFGGNSNDFLFVAIFVLIIIGGGIIIASGGNIWGIVLAGGFFFVGLMFFVVVGWVSPFFLIGGIILALILFVFSFMASQKG